MTLVPTTSHWGAFNVRVEDDEVVEVVPHPADPDPSPLLGNIAGAAPPPHARRPAADPPRLARARPGPATRPRRTSRSSRSPGTRRSTCVAAELDRVRDEHGNEAIFGGSYGWASAGRFHHAQSQLHRFLNLLGGYTGSVNTYSIGASSVLLPHLVGERRRRCSAGDDAGRRSSSTPSCSSPSAACPAKNVFVTPGGATRHTSRGHLRRGRSRAALEFALVSPLRDDLPADLPTHAGTRCGPARDVALMLGAGPHAGRRGPGRPGVPRPLLRRAPTSSTRYLLRRRRTAWRRTPSGRRRSARSPPTTSARWRGGMAAGRTLVTVTWSLQRTEHGEQPVWAGAGAGGAARPDRPAGRRLRPRLRLDGRRRQHAAARLRAARASRRAATRCRTFIPVARIADMLLHPGEPFDYDGAALHLPRHPARLLGRRQPVPPPPGPRTGCGAALAAARHGRRARAVLDADGPARRHRAAGDDDARARRHRRRPARHAPHRHAARGRAARRGPRRLRRSSPAWPSGSGVGERVHRRPHAAAVAAAPLRAPGAATARSVGSSVPAFDAVLGATAGSSSPGRRSRARRCSRRSAPIPRPTRCATPSGRIELCSETIAVVRLRRLPRPPGLARAGRAGGRRPSASRCT